MHLPSAASILLAAASLPLASAGKDHGHGKKQGLDTLAKKAGLKYFGSATDSPGQRERAGLEASYSKYDEIMWKSDEFGSTTPTNGQKVCCAGPIEPLKTIRYASETDRLPGVWNIVAVRRA